MNAISIRKEQDCEIKINSNPMDSDTKQMT